MSEKSYEDNFNRVDIEVSKMINKIESKIMLIKNNSGYGSILINIYDKKVTNIKTTISEDVK